MTCKNCYKRLEAQKKLDIHFDWLDCPYKCVYGDKMLDKFKKSASKTLREFREMQSEVE